MKVNADLTKILTKEHEEKWVALTKNHDKLVDCASNLKILRDRLGEHRNDYVYMRVLRSDMEYSFSFT
ncbi:hypothetical protein HZC00_03520 [Candidatus Kaiserbacteria bacterium]|nr:hypothetical protein [Candidatus Kaiserbacteria bacterium]